MQRGGVGHGRRGLRQVDLDGVVKRADARGPPQLLRGLDGHARIEEDAAWSQPTVVVEILRAVERHPEDAVVLGRAERGRDRQQGDRVAAQRRHLQRVRILEHYPPASQQPSASAAASAFAASVTDPPPTVTIASGPTADPSSISWSTAATGTCWT